MQALGWAEGHCSPLSSIPEAGGIGGSCQVQVEGQLVQAGLARLGHGTPAAGQPCPPHGGFSLCSWRR